MNIVIAGGGSVGRFIAEQLVGSGHHVTIVDNDARRRGAVTTAPSRASIG